MADQNVKVKIDLDVTEFNKNAKAMSDALSKILGKDIEIFNGKIAKTKKLVEDTEKAMGAAGNAAGKSGNSVKKSNQQWTNFALVIQDLPYGFRGIQNNLPALMGGIAGIAGPLYLVGSAVIAFFAAWDSGIIDFGKSTKIAKDYANSFAESLSNETIKYESLYRVATDVNTSMNDRIKAAKLLKEEYPGLLEKYSEEEIALGKAKTAFDDLSSSILKYAKAQAAVSVLTDLTKKQLLVEGERADLLSEYAKNPISKFSREDAKGVNKVYGALSAYNTELNARTYALSKNAKAYNELQAQIDKYNSILDKNIVANKELEDFKTDPTKDAEKAAKEAQRIADEAQRDKERNWAREQKVRMEIIAFETKLQNDLQKLEDDKLKKQERIDAITEGNAQSITNALRNIKQGFLKDDLSAIDKNTKQELRLNKNSRRASIEALKKEQTSLLALKQKDIFEGTDTTSIDKKLEDNANALQVYSDVWTNTSDQINNAVESMIEGGISTFAENIGKALAGGDVNLFDGILGILAEGLSTIGKALIAYGVAMDAFKKAFTNPYAAIAAGAALVVIGSFIATKVGQMAAGGASDKGGATPFANGGIVSGPTLGLMGEYPGAKSNPEVIAPLDKLKDMIGGGNGGGSFVLRGTDLVLAMNRSETSLNLRR